MEIMIELTKEMVEQWCEANGHGLIKLYEKGDARPMTAREIKIEGIKGIIARVCKHVDIPVEDIQKKCRKREMVEARQLIHTIAKEHSGVSLAKIGWLVGKLNHATILNSAKTINNLIETDSTFREKYKDILFLYSLDK